MAARNIEEINAFLQRRLRETGRQWVTVNEAAEWLDNAGLLRDNPSTPGLPLRKLCREGSIMGQRQEPPQKNGRWIIDKVTGEIIM